MRTATRLCEFFLKASALPVIDRQQRDVHLFLLMACALPGFRIRARCRAHPQPASLFVQAPLRLTKNFRARSHTRIRRAFLASICCARVAILSVVFAHYSVVIYDHMPWWYGLIGHGGFYGVELFFVLSGFLIGRILLRSEQQLAQPVGIAVFYIRRWFRTLPLFWLFIAINVLLEFFLRNRRLTLTEILGHGFFLQNFAGLKMSFFGESWSLAVEEWFYLLFPLALWLGLKIWKRFDTVFLLTAAAFFLFSIVARMLSAPHPNASWTDWQRMVVIYRFDALMIGVFAAWLSLRFSNAWRARPAISALAGLVLLLAMYATLWRFSDHQLMQGADSYFARTFRFTFVSVGFALLLPIASNWKLNRENFASLTIRPHRALVCTHSTSFTWSFTTSSPKISSAPGKHPRFTASLRLPCRSPPPSRSARCSIAFTNRAAPICATKSHRESCVLASARMRRRQSCKFREV